MDVVRVKKAYEHKLIKIPGVVGVATNPTKKLLLLLSSPKYLKTTPNVVAGIPVKKVVVGEMRALGVSQVSGNQFTPNIPNRQKVRPLVGGISISPPERIAGTLGIITEDDVILTNAHVAAINYITGKFEPKKTPIYQPGWLDGGTKEDEVGELEIYTNIRPNTPRTVDGATCTISTDYMKMNVMGIGELEGWTIPERGSVVYKSGRTTGVTSSVVLTNDATIKMCGYPWGYTVFKECIVTVPAIAKEGDSGSVLVEENHVAGLVFGGSPLATAACRMDNVIPELGVCLGKRYKVKERGIMDDLSDVVKASILSVLPALGVIVCNQR